MCLCAVNEVKRGPKKKQQQGTSQVPAPLLAAQHAPGAAQQAAEGRVECAEGQAAEEQAQAQALPSIGELLREGADVVVVDEAHVVKNEKVMAGRTAASSLLITAHAC